MKWLTFVILLISFNISANNLTCEMAGDKTAIFFANGMFNKQGDIDNSLIRIKRDIDFLYDDGDGSLTISEEEYSSIIYESALNRSELLPFQLFEVLKQRADSENTDWYSRWSKVWNGVEKIPVDDFNNSTGYLVDEISDPMADAMRLDIDGHYYDGDLRQQVSDYIDLLKQGYRIIIVAHSQGNMYSNLAWKLIEAEDPELVKSVYIIGIATPDKIAFGDYVTLNRDIVIKGVEGFFPSTLDPTKNLTDDFSDDFMGHGFLKEYMRIDGASSLIKDYLAYGLNNLPYPEVETELNPSNLPEGRLGCDTSVYVWAGAQEVVNGTVTIPFDVDYLRLELEFDTGILSKASAVEITSNGEQLIIDKGDFIVEDQTVQIDISAIAEGMSSPQF